MARSIRASSYVARLDPDWEERLSGTHSVTMGASWQAQVVIYTLSGGRGGSAH